MKYTKLFNNHSEYEEYIGSVGFITPNVSWCIEDEEAHCTPLTTLWYPDITCINNRVMISCRTPNATIHYRLNESGEFSAYTNAITITEDTVVEAYSTLESETSETVKQTCIYTDGIAAPTIYCDGEYVTINSETPSVDIYYRLNESGNYSGYTTSFEITANTVVEAYAELDEKRSDTTKQNCIYVPTPDEPVIACDGEHITITCATVGATIYYRLNEIGNYGQYNGAITITADTIVETYSSNNNKTSNIVKQTCEYSHDYSQDYLTLDIITSGTILWKTIGSISKTISYSNDGGDTWTSITSTTAGTQINVSAGDKILLKGTNDQYSTSKTNYCAFKPGTATFNIEGNIMSIVSGDSFTSATSFTKTYVFCSLFNESNAVSAEHLILPVMTLTDDSYRAMFANAKGLTKAPELPATILSKECYWYMFENCAITTAPELPATTLATSCYGHMFTGCTSLNYVKCLATNKSAYNCTVEWLLSVSPTGTFVKDANTNWTTGASGIPTGWVVKDDGAITEPTISFDDFDTITMSCETTGATIYYRLNQGGNYSAYTTAIVITADTTVEAYSEKDGDTSNTVSRTCIYVGYNPFEYSNRSLNSWTYVNDSIDVQVPYSVNAIDGHSAHYKTDGDNPKLPFSFDTSFGLREAQPTYLWFEHADQSADIYVDNTLVETHYGGYNAFFSDISNYVHSGTNNIRVSLRNKQRSDLAPCAGDFNFNATLGYVKLFTSPYMPNKEYGYDGFHVTSQFEYATTANTTATAATITVKTSIPTGATVNCIIKSGNTNIYSATSASTGEEMAFVTPSITGSNLHLWGGMDDPFLYDITLEIYHGQDLYHRYTRGYGLRFYEYVINDTVKYGTVGNPYTGFLLNGQAYLLRGVCMHSDKANKANALTSADIAADFNIIQELGCNFIRLAHYPHPKEVYDTCDRLGIVVQTEVPWVNQSSSGQPEAYYTRLEGQYDDMVKQHYNHPCILFWGLANEITPSTTSFTKSKIEQYTAQIKALDSERMVGFVMSHSYNSPTSFGTPNVDWFGCNIYVGWYVDKNSNDPTSQLNTRKNNFITNANKPFAFSEYGCGGTQRCHSDDPQTTTTKGTNQPRHDIEYEMWIHEGHVAAIRNFPQLLFTAQWQLFDIAVYNRQEGYTVCLDGETTSTDDNLKYLNNKGLVERDHVTKKDVFYIYKAEWSDEKFVHICGKDYTNKTNRVIKCYTNDGNTLSMTINNGTPIVATVTDHIATFAAQNFNSGDVVRVSGNDTNDTFTFE